MKYSDLMIGRPEPDEAAAYYFTSIDRVAGDDATSAIRSQLDETLAFFSEISEDKSLHRYAPEKWSIRQTLNHVEAALPSFDQDVAVSAAVADAIPWAAHIEEFRRVRLSTISFFEHAPSEAWTRAGIASGNRVSVRALAFHHCGASDAPLENS